MASSRLVLPLPLSPERMLIGGEGERVTGCRLRTAVTVKRVRDIQRLQTHRHNDIRGVVVVSLLHQGTAVGIGENQTHLVGGHHTQHVEQVADVETNFQRAAAVIHGDLFFRFFLLRVVSLNFQQARFQLQANAAVLFVGQNRGTAERFTQALTISNHQLVTTTRQHTLVVWEFTVDQFRGEGERAGGRADVVLTENDADAAILLSEQTSQFENTFARHDDLMTFNLLDRRFHGAHGQAVTVGGNGAEDSGLYFQQHAVEVITHVLLGHGKAGAFDQTAQSALYQVEGQRTWAFFDSREIIGGQGGQTEAAAAGRLLQISISLRAGTVISPDSAGSSRVTRPTSSTSRSVPVSDSCWPSTTSSTLERTGKV